MHGPSGHAPACPFPHESLHRSIGPARRAWWAEPQEALHIPALTLGLRACALRGVQVPEDGILINGLWVDGARWDHARQWLAESEPGVMISPLPVIHFSPVSSPAIRAEAMRAALCALALGRPAALPIVPC